MVTDWPRYLREVAMGLRTMGFPISAPSLEQLAAAWDAERAQAAADRAALAELRSRYAAQMGTERSLHEREVKALRAALHNLEIERNAQFKIWAELRKLFGAAPNESLPAVCNQAVADLADVRAALAQLKNAFHVTERLRQDAVFALAQAQALLADYEAHCQRTPDGDLILRGNDVDALLAALSGGAR